jgi:hypothetical protein
LLGMCKRFVGFAVVWCVAGRLRIFAGVCAQKRCEG